VTTRDQVHKWFFYALGLVPIWVLDAFVLNRIAPFGVIPMLLPLAVAAVAVLLLRRIVRHPLGVAAGFLILSGGVGNILDRVRLGYVVDMFHLEFWPSYPVFNVADICVVCGGIGFCLYYLLLHGKEEKHDPPAADG